MAGMGSRSKTPAGLYGIIAFKAVKGLFFMSLAFGIYSLIDNNLPEEFRRLLHFFKLDPERQFFQNIETHIQAVTPKELIGLASGSLLYSLPSLAEAVGLVMRRSWAGWMAIGESSFFIPIELYELARKFSLPLLGITIINVLIVWYLVQNRERLFAHHGHETDGK
jgi:uncharacterized membrane protein (DUF2068 family)